jgi:hypothetical protein
MSVASSVRFMSEDQLQNLVATPAVLTRYATIRV